ncbi:hypothetical protein PTTG_04922 [Puccinia triticina 1-1 BBBD Race 1]|uniref:Uncharacterized protein n=1 Tax=Puccinia triticina (isolate 1-1 / race 1 (BBBD)) TaxID=630390 RepID=A0A180GFR2_PUCT1|nr:hypothetical protein PTTG_04922 [Puccinia triticina 1-1 BBBD Race 1]
MTSAGHRSSTSTRRGYFLPPRIVDTTRITVSMKTVWNSLRPTLLSSPRRKWVETMGYQVGSTLLGSPRDRLTVEPTAQLDKESSWIPQRVIHGSPQAPRGADGNRTPDPQPFINHDIGDLAIFVKSGNGSTVSRTIGSPAFLGPELINTDKPNGPVSCIATDIICVNSKRFDNHTKD